MKRASRLVVQACFISLMVRLSVHEKTSNECRFTHLPTSLVFTVAGLVGEEILACVFSLTLSSILTCSRDYLSKYCKALLIAKHVPRFGKEGPRKIIIHIGGFSILKLHQLQMESIF